MFAGRAHDHLMCVCVHLFFRSLSQGKYSLPRLFIGPLAISVHGEKITSVILPPNKVERPGTNFCPQGSGTLFCGRVLQTARNVWFACRLGLDQLWSLGIMRVGSIKILGNQNWLILAFLSIKPPKNPFNNKVSINSLSILTPILLGVNPKLVMQADPTTNSFCAFPLPSLGLLTSSSSSSPSPSPPLLRRRWWGSWNWLKNEAISVN